MKILAINFGSTSTKLAVFEDETRLDERSISHDPAELLKFDDAYDQYDMRKALVDEFLADNGLRYEDVGCVIVNGGLLPVPVEAGAYRVDQKMIDDLYERPLNKHPGNFGPKLAYDICKASGGLPLIYDSATVDERDEEYKLTGVPEIKRYARGHVLNTRAKALRLCKEKGWDYREKTIIVVHMGGGTGANIQSHGRMIDAISDDIGPFSPTRMGGVPGYELVKLAMSGQYDYKALMNKLQRQSGLMGHLGTTDLREVEKRIASGDHYADTVHKAMCILIAKAVGQLATDVNGAVDAIVLTGGMAYSRLTVERINERVSFIAPVFVMPGEEEMEAMAAGALRVLKNEEGVKEYCG